MDPNNYSEFFYLMNVVCGDMTQFLLWFTRDDVQTQPVLIFRAFFVAAVTGCTDKCVTIIDSGTVSDDDIEWAFRQACVLGQLEIAQHIAQCGRITSQQVRAALFDACPTHTTVVN
jgi:hypothetical protein